MHRTTSAIVASVLVLTAWWGASSRNLSAQAEPGPQRTVNRAKTSAAPTDEQRRAALALRIQSMLSKGEGRRLVDASHPPLDPQQTGRRQGASTATLAAAGAPRQLSAPTRQQRPRVLYRTPKLDLRSPPQIPNDALECLTQALYYEARTESEEGQAAVAEVILNRANSGRYPRDVCQVVYQRNSRTCQFTFTCDGSIGRSAINSVAWQRARRIAQSVYTGQSKLALPQNSVNYHATYVRPGWSARLERVRRIGAHVFYGAPIQGGTPGEYMGPPPARDLVFTRNEAIERAYAVLTGRRDDRGLD